MESIDTVYRGCRPMVNESAPTNPGTGDTDTPGNIVKHLMDMTARQLNFETRLAVMLQGQGELIKLLTERVGLLEDTGQVNHDALAYQLSQMRKEWTDFTSWLQLMAPTFPGFRDNTKGPRGVSQL